MRATSRSTSATSTRSSGGPRGVTASFFRELLRQAALEAAEDASDVVRDEHVARALDRLLARASAMTKVLLGAERPNAAPAVPPPSRGWLRAQTFVVE
jgi:hypothetical protein